MKSKATLLVTALILGQFLACLGSTQELWPFNPILVYVEPVPQRVADARLVAYRQGQEEDIAALGWTSERVRGRLSTILLGIEKEEERNEQLKQLTRSYQHAGQDWQGLRLYRVTWDLNEGTRTERLLIAEVPFEPR